MHRNGWTEFLFGLLAGATASSFAFTAYLEYSGASVSVLAKSLAAILGAVLGGTLTLV